MPMVGPQLPPHLADKRKRDDSDEGSEEAAGTKTASLGPQRPTAAAAGPDPQQPAVPSKRDEWMTMAPTSSDWSARIDPTKLKNRKFATGKTPSSAGTMAAASAAWHETPGQKQARLQRELMGVKDNAHTPSSKAPPQPSPHDAYTHDDHDEEATQKRMNEYNESRGPSLYEAHQVQKRRPGGKDNDDDDPSARPFDREKDIAGGLQMNSTRRREMMQKASDFGSRFSTAKYL
ncbi:hypothetical protein DV736_g4343, partial [Chaetothyriales sp. CBS 134916]